MECMLYRLHKCWNENKIIFIYGENIKLQNKGEREKYNSICSFAVSAAVDSKPS